MNRITNYLPSKPSSKPASPPAYIGMVIDTHVRWMIRRDMAEVLAIDNNPDTFAFDSAWSEEDFIDSLRHKNTIGMVVEHQDQVIGFMIFELFKTKLVLIRIAVAKNYRYRGIGRMMIDKLASKLSYSRRINVDTIVDESNLSAQLFFRSVGYRAIKVNNDNTYLFRYTL